VGVAGSGSNDDDFIVDGNKDENGTAAAADDDGTDDVNDSDSTDAGAEAERVTAQ
jgi:hypothetical protein